MDLIIEVRFKKTGKFIYVDPLKFNFKVGDMIIANSDRGEELARVVKIIPRDKVPKSAEIVSIIKPATHKDLLIQEENEKDAELVTEFCKEQAKKLDLKMKVLYSEYIFDRSKLIIYFSAEERVDFRELVKVLANEYRTRIELRQIGPRDEVKSFCNLGMCGREVCCKSFLQDFEPVTIKMAKDQGLQINMSKLSGACGRLMCCLKYEDEVYRENMKKLPKIGEIVTINGEEGKVIGLDILNLKVKLKLTKPDQSEIYEIHSLDEIDVKNKKQENE